MPTQDGSHTADASSLPSAAAAAPARIATRSTAEPGAKEQRMQAHMDPDTVEAIDRLTKEQEAILANIPELPPAEDHASIAILAGWADGIISDEYVRAYMANYADCAECEDNYSFYKAIRAEIATEPRQRAQRRRKEQMENAQRSARFADDFSAL